MPVAGVGIDLVEVDRLERALARRPRLRARLFTQAELDYADARSRPGRHLAARFAAKEAVAKSLGLRGWSFGDVEVVAGEPPVVHLTGRAARRADAIDAHVRISLTHGRDLAAAIACAERP
jgi:holo-[acyl-carrier protein] synthase